MDAALTFTGSRPAAAARYVNLLQKLEASCVTCSCAPADRRTSPRPSSLHASALHLRTPTRAGRGPLPRPHDDCCSGSWHYELDQTSSLPSPLRSLSGTVDSSCCATSTSLYSYAPPCGAWATPLLDTAPSVRRATVAAASSSSSSSSPPLFLVRLHQRRSRHVHDRRDTHQRHTPSTVRERDTVTAPSATRGVYPAPRDQLSTGQHQTPSRQRRGGGLAGIAPAISPTADDYLSHYLTQYRRRSCRTEYGAHNPQRTSAEDSGETSAASAREGRRRSLCLATPVCSPIVAEASVVGGRRRRDVGNSPDAMCRLFTSDSVEGDETRWP